MLSPTGERISGEKKLILRLLYLNRKLMASPHGAADKLRHKEEMMKVKTTDNASISYTLSEQMIEGEKLTMVTFPLLSETDLTEHGFTTRIGGVSKGPYASMNLGLSRKDDPSAVRENYRRAALALNRKPEDIVLSYQTHTSNIRKVTEDDRGKGFSLERDYKDIDGLMTDVPGILLVTLHADCTPLFFLDPVHPAIGLAHAGWRGTAGKIGAKMVAKMQEAYGSDPSSMLVVIGPSICGDCYEVGEDVAEIFRTAFGADVCREQDILRRGGLQGEEDKYRLNMWAANAWQLKQAGILPSHLCISGICTCENSDLFFSHRAVHGGERGNLGAFLSLKPRREEN